MDKFFYFASKVVIILPIIIILIALIIKFNQNRQYSQKFTLPPTNKSISTITTIPTATTAAQFNLVGPLICQIKENKASISAYIKDRKVFLTKNEENKIDYFLIKDDCLYWWEGRKYSGQKMCGVGYYLSYFEKFFHLGLLGRSNLNLAPLINNCKKEEIKEERVFEVPSNILFKNINL